MSIETLQQRLSDLHFSLEEQVKAYHTEQDDAAKVHSDWQDDEPDSDASDEDHDAWQDDEPQLVDNEAKINALESARDKINEAINELDVALED